MRILVAAVGRSRAGPEAALFEHFSGRIKTWPFSLQEVELKRNVPAGQAVGAEG